jgi:hypothetical protein
MPAIDPGVAADMSDLDLWQAVEARALERRVDREAILACSSAAFEALAKACFDGPPDAFICARLSRMHQTRRTAEASASEGEGKLQVVESKAATLVAPAHGEPPRNSFEKRAIRAAGYTQMPKDFGPNRRLLALDPRMWVVLLARGEYVPEGIVCLLKEVYSSELRAHKDQMWFTHQIDDAECLLAAMLSLMKRLTDDECPLVAVAELLVVAERVILKLESRRRCIRNEGPPTKEDAQASTNPTPLWLWKSWKGVKKGRDEGGSQESPRKKR